MLLGATGPQGSFQAEEDFIKELIIEKRFAEAYSLLKRETPNKPATQFNLALCFYWVENYKEAISCLDKALAQLSAAGSNSNLNADQNDKAIRDKQNQTDDHLLPVTAKYIEIFNWQVRDSITRIKTDCWLRLGEFAKVIETAAPIAYKNYSNINEALQLAKNKLNL